MNGTLDITLPSGKTLTAPRGAKAETLLPWFEDTGDPVVAVRICNEIVALGSALEISAAVFPVSAGSREGAAIYRRSLAFLLAMAARDLFPDTRPVIGHSLGNSYYYTLDLKRGRGEAAPAGFGIQDRESVPEADGVRRLERRMREIAALDLPIEPEYIAWTEAEELFRTTGQDDTLMLLERRAGAKVRINTCDGCVSLYIEPLVPRTGLLTAFELLPYREGFLLRFPGEGAGQDIEPFTDSPRIFQVYHEYKKWGRIVGVHSAGDLNRLVAGRNVRDFIRIAEAFQARKISGLAEKIYELRDRVKAVLIAGPSSSGKTTTAKRLSIELLTLGIAPVAISLDDYYAGTDRTPKDETGKPDFEALEALDIPFLNDQLLALFDGKEVTLPSYDFKTGARRATGGATIRMGRRSVLILEGIHGLNDRLTPKIPRETKFKIYVSALTQLNLDDQNRIPATDNRLLRRMVRDYNFRGSGAARTISMWPNVQRGAFRHVFAFQESADAVFNSALDYELSVLKFYAEPLLYSVKPNQEEYAEAARLLAFLENFAPIPPQYVPGQSILREFIGESDFKY